MQNVARTVDEVRHVSVPNHLLEHTRSEGPLEALLEMKACLEEIERNREAEVLGDVYQHAINAADFGGLALSPDHKLTADAEAEVLFLLSAYLEGLNSADRQAAQMKPLEERPHGRRGMTLAEKILAAHDIERRGEVKPGDVIRVDIDWVIASELSWSGMEKTYNEMGQPGIFRNDRIWLAGDHIVDPRIKGQPKIKSLIDASERARRTFKLSEYQGMNYTIMHTEFCRERAQPGMLVIGSDSHTCSAGSVSALAIGLGVADVTMPMITGETWFKVPETVEIRFVGRPQPGLGGKDVILYVLQQLKRNTVAADRIVEYTGPGLKHLSCDARFAISNMTTVSKTQVFIAEYWLTMNRSLEELQASLFQMRRLFISSTSARTPNTSGYQHTTNQTKTRNTPRLISSTCRKSSLSSPATPRLMMSFLSVKSAARSWTAASSAPAPQPEKI